jgi:hypothetical protein
VREGRELRRRCERIVEGLEMPDPFDLEVFCRSIGAARGRPLRVVLQPGGGGSGSPCGMWVAYDTEDVIVIDQRTSSLHQQHIGLHEVGHIVAGHNSEQGLAIDSVLRLLPDLDPAVVRLVLGRASYASTQEREAETIALLLSGRIAASRRDRNVYDVGSATGEALRRLDGAFGGRDR